MEGNSQSRTCPWLRESSLSWGSEAAWPQGLEPCPQWEPRCQRSGRPPGSQFQTLGPVPGPPQLPTLGAAWTPSPPTHQPFSRPPAEPWPRASGPPSGWGQCGGRRRCPQGAGAPDRRGWDGPQEPGSEGLSRGDPCPQMSKRGPEARKARVQHVEGTAPWMGEASRRVEGRDEP